MDLIRLEQLNVGQRLNDVSLNLAHGEMLGIIGPNGSGKSTLLHCLAGILPYRGRVEFAGANLAHLPSQTRAQKIAFVPQASHSAWSLSVEDIVTLGRLPWADEDAPAIANAMAHTGVSEWRTRRVDTLSGGEQSRVWLARVLAGQPMLLLADEPVASLDLYYQQQVMQSLRGYAEDAQSVILSIHDLALAARYCDKLCLLNHGRIHAIGTPQQVLTEANISAVFKVQAHIDFTVTPALIVPR